MEGFLCRKGRKKAHIPVKERAEVVVSAAKTVRRAFL
jgi:hypothetical protein